MLPPPITTDELFTASEKELHEQIKWRLMSMKGSAYHPEKIGPLIYDTGCLVAAISRISELSSIRLEKQTTTLIRLTWAIVALSVLLLFFTIVLYEDSHAQIQRDKSAEHHNPASP